MIEEMMLRTHVIDVKRYIYHAKSYRSHHMGKQDDNKYINVFFEKFRSHKKVISSWKDETYQSLNKEYIPFS